jgi:hypothetical protein
MEPMNHFYLFPNRGKPHEISSEPPRDEACESLSFPTREAKRRLWGGNTAKHSKSFCPLFPCLSHQILSLRGHNGAVLGLYGVKAGTGGVRSWPHGV